jgi:hypothetical protein
LSTSTGADAPNQAAGIGTMEYVGMFMPANFVWNVATPTDDRNLVLCPLLLELLTAPEKLPDFALSGVLIALEYGVIGRPAVAAKLLEHDAVAVLMNIIRQASPTELITTAGFSRQPHGVALIAMRDLVETAQAGGADLTTQLLTSGFIDTLLSALSAVEEVGADNITGCTFVHGALGILTLLTGEAMPQIEDKLRAIPSALRYLKESKITNLADFGQTSGTFATIVAGECLTLLCCVELLNLTRMLVTANLWGKDEDNPFEFARECRQVVRALTAASHPITLSLGGPLAILVDRGRHRRIHCTRHRGHALRSMGLCHGAGRQPLPWAAVAMHQRCGQADAPQQCGLHPPPD